MSAARLLAVDAGGSSTRAVVLAADRTYLGVGVGAAVERPPLAEVAPGRSVACFLPLVGGRGLPVQDTGLTAR